MTPGENYLDVNRANWDARAPLHAASPGYQRERFVRDPQHVSDVVRFDLPRLGDIAGMRAVHLQCHIGTDTLSLHRLGAKVTGLDFSPASLAEARRLAADTGAAIDYVEADVARAAEALEPGTFDLVYTGIGAIGWLPKIRPWAAAVSALLKPGGRFFMREGHPLMWTLDESDADRLTPRFGYFEHEDPLVFDSAETYVATSGVISATRTMEWNHGLAETVQALLDEGLRLEAITEHDSVPWLALPGHMAGPGPDGEYRMRPERPRLPLTWTVQATKL
ncbi:bifunctional 2-polyprenyl-6-hydroxyphenol methylase/3-demethylubiquinol 3-O-methyltransferase UbiG [uncultured Schumannella sp.]|uniref:class I SAM-dependent methyltransferase n=1 Tax=uncultured Schumannella sp. TaxID=1195956 RepID=UPI0025DA5DBE|nr:class I SAM-dependent methyltransferase [uncultured Schumannella sp.]